MTQLESSKASRRRLTNRFLLAAALGTAATTLSWHGPTGLVVDLGHLRSRVLATLRGWPFTWAAMPLGDSRPVALDTPEMEFIWPGFLFDTLAWGLIPLAGFELWDRRQRNRRRRRRKSGLCETCGYDLQGTIEPRCPECGHSFVREERCIISEES